jgi:hypothetical protein
MKERIRAGMCTERASPTIVRIMKSREIRWVSCSTHARDEKLITEIKSENVEGRDHLQDLGVDERIILNRMLRWIHVAKVGFSGDFFLGTH